MKIVKLIIIVMIFACLSVTVFAQDLKGIIYVSNQTEAFDQDKIVREYIPEETAYCAFFVQDFSTDSTGAFNLSADIKLSDPQGKVVFEEKNYAKAKGSISQSQKMLILDSSFDLEFDETDLLGMYTLEIFVKDNINGDRDTTKTTILLFDSEKSKSIIMAPVKNVNDLDELWAEYFRSKNPWAVKRIISVLSLKKESPHLGDALIAEAAKWSLEVNAKEYLEVLSICKQSLEYTKATTKEILKEVIKNAE